MLASKTRTVCRESPQFTAACKVKGALCERKGVKGLSAGGTCWKREAVKASREHILEPVDGPPLKKKKKKIGLKAVHFCTTCVTQQPRNSGLKRVLQYSCFSGSLLALSWLPHPCSDLHMYLSWNVRSPPCPWHSCLAVWDRANFMGPEAMRNPCRAVRGSSEQEQSCDLLEG